MIMRDTEDGRRGCGTRGCHRRKNKECSGDICPGSFDGGENLKKRG